MESLDDRDRRVEIGERIVLGEPYVAGADLDVCGALADQRGDTTFGERMLQRRREGRLDRGERRVHRAAAAFAHTFGGTVASREVAVAVRRSGGHGKRLGGLRAPGTTPMN
jgi:hypothetical protein